MADSSLVEHARRELHAAGLFKHPVYGDLLGRHVLDLVKTFDQQGHSGFSAGLAVQLFSELVQWHKLPVPDRG